MLQDVNNSMILIIEDNQTQQNIMQVFLKSFGFQLISAYDGVEAFRVLENIIPDLILLDVMLPGMDGFEICRRLKSNPRTSEIPIIFITALRNQQDIIAGLQAGGADYLGKPFNQEELIARVSTHLSLKISKDMIIEHNEALQAEVLKQQKIKKALELSEQKFKIAFNANPSIMLIANYETNDIIEVNQTFLQTLGYTREEVRHRTTADLELFNDIKVRDKLIERLKNDNSVANAEAVLRRKDGGLLPVLISAEYILINDEKCYISVITDISERKRFEETIRTVNKRYKKISKLTSDFAFSIVKSDNNWEAEWTFGSLSKLCGYSFSEIKDSESLSHFINEKIGLNSHMIFEMLLTKNIYEQTEKIISKNGEEVWLRAYLEPEFDDNEMIRIYGSLKDVSKVKKIELALKTSQERFMRITESANSIIGELSQDGRIIYANQGFAKYLDYSPEALIGINFLDLVFEEDREIIYSKSELLLQTNQAQECILRILKADGTFHWFNCNANFVNVNNEYKTIVFVCIDIDERIKSEQELQNAYSNIETLNRTKDTFFSIIAHDLKGPVSSFKYLTETLSATLNLMSEEEIEEAIDNLHSNTVQLLTLLEDLLEWSRTQTGQLSYEPEYLPIKYIIDNTLLLTKSNADKKQISIINEVEDNLKVYADTRMVSGIIRNLIGNAIKFTGIDGWIRISAQLIVNSHGQEMIEILVADSGVGIPPERINTLFSIDSNSSTPGTEDEKGTGLGLILCHEFANKNFGSIRVESEVGVGSTFIVTLPTSDFLS